MTIAMLGHLLGLALGLGGAFCTEMLLLRLLHRPIAAPDADAVRATAGMVVLGYCLLVVSGLGFLAIYAGASPEKLLNPKLWAKIAIVAALGLNGVIVHRAVLRPLRRRIGRSLLEGMTPARRLGCILAGSVSTVSWLAAVLLGAVPQLNFLAPVQLYLLVWLAAVALAFPIGLVIAGLVPLWPRRPALRGGGA